MTTPQLYLGVDPGCDGAAALIGSNGTLIALLSFGASTEADIARSVEEWKCWGKVFGVLEEVHSMPGQGVSSTFKFGRAYGFIRGVLIAAGIPFDDATPQKWQRELKCLTGGDKNISKAKAQQLFPGVKVTNKTADSVCIAEYAKRLYHQRNGV